MHRAHTAPDLPLVRLRPPAPEKIGYLPIGADMLYFVQHLALGERCGKVLIAGPFGLERQTSYTTWVRWARTLAAQGFDVLHFDFRGMGESTGQFQALSLADWEQDLLAAYRFLRSDEPAPVLLMGLRFGALLVSRIFERGEGDGMLVWEPPATGQAMLTEVLRRKLASDLMERVPGSRRSRDGYIADLLDGQSVEVEGHIWSQRLWRGAASYSYKDPPATERRPWMVVHLDRTPGALSQSPAHHAVIPVPKPPFWGHDPLAVAPVSDLFEHGTAFLLSAASEGVPAS